MWKDGAPLLTHLDMELTERCNNNCIHCCINLPPDDTAAKDRELSSGRIKEILTEAASLGCLSVRFTGGEPLLRDDFEELYIFSRKLGLKVLLFTNATLITPRVAALLVQIPPLEKVEISVYGMNRKAYEAVTRTPGSHAAAWQGIHLLIEKNIPFVVKGALLPSNQQERAAFETWATTIPWMDAPPSYSMFFDLRCRGDSDDKNLRIKALRLSPAEGLKILTRQPEAYLEGMREFCSKFTRPPGENLFSCGAGIRRGCVDAYGYVQPCVMLRHPDVTVDLKKGSLKAALTDVFPGTRQATASNPDYIARCARCFLKGLCDQCPARSWTEHGTLDTPVEYLCEIAHAQARYLGLLKEDETAWNVKDWKERIRRFSGKNAVEHSKPCLT